VVREPPVGTFALAEDGTYTYVGVDTDFDYQLYIDGVPSGAPVTVLSGTPRPATCLRRRPRWREPQPLC